MSHFQPYEVYKHPDFSQIIQSCLCCLLDTTSTRPAFTSTSAASGCSLPRRRGRSSVTLFMSTKRTEDFYSQVNCTSKIVLAKRTSDFHSQVNCTSKIVLAKRTSDFHSQVNSRCASKCTSDFHSQVNCTSKIVLATSDFTFTHKSTQEVLASAPPTFTRKSTAILRLYLPLVTLLSLTSQHERAIQVHTEERATQVHSQVHL